MQQRLMSGYDKHIAGHRKFCRAKSCSSADPPGEPSLAMRKMKMVPVPGGAWPNTSTRGTPDRQFRNGRQGAGHYRSVALHLPNPGNCLGTERP